MADEGWWNPLPQSAKSKWYDSTDRYPRSVLEFASDKQTVKLHPTQKPVALLEYLIATYTTADMTILDNTMGSGSTGVAAARLGRRFIGIEKDRDYFDIACDRMNTAKAQERLFV